MNLVDQLLENDEIDAKSWIMRKFRGPHYHVVQHDAGLWEVMSPERDEARTVTYGWIHDNGHKYAHPDDRRISPVVYTCYQGWDSCVGVGRIGETHHFQGAVKLCIDNWKLNNQPSETH